MTLANNFSINKFHILAEASKINSMIFEESESNYTFFDYWKVIGNSCGVMVRKTLGYVPGGRRF